MFGTTLHMANRDAAFVRGREARAAATREERPRLEQLVTATGIDDALKPGRQSRPFFFSLVYFLSEEIVLNHSELLTHPAIEGERKPTRPADCNRPSHHPPTRTQHNTTPGAGQHTN